jgi:putative membrane protein
MTAADLPAINASLNAIAAFLLMLGIFFIKQDRKQAHGYAMGGAFVVSCIFLVFYVLHKILMKGVHTPFAGPEPWRTIYYVMLITHIILAIAVPPLAIITMRHALAGRYEKHRALAKITFPVWFYVSVTGVLVYFFLYRWFPAATA